jgi:hydrogenase nickel incorporation protein HypB
MTPGQIKVVERILSANDQIAEENRLRLLGQGILGVNIMASPGAGKTSVIMATIRALQGRLRVGVIEGDVASSVDAERVATLGVPVIQINTGGGCHLDARQVQEALNGLPLDRIDLLFIENIGNLICPTAFLLGESLRVAIASIPEGDDKPVKYPELFHQAAAVVLNKMDLLPYVQFDVPVFHEHILGLNQKGRIFEVSCTTGLGIQLWAEWLISRREEITHEAS